MLRQARAAGCLALVLVALPCAAAEGAPIDDFQAVALDFRGDGTITPCRFTQAQLLNARNVAATVRDLEDYASGLRAEIAREISRHASGGWSSRRARSPLRRVEITAIRPRGGLSESVTIRNSGPRSVNLAGATLRDRRGNRVRLPRGTRLAGGRSLHVTTGCAAGQRRAARRGARLYACRRSGLWDDRGDVVKLVDARGAVVAQRGYGSLRRVVRF